MSSPPDLSSSQRISSLADATPRPGLNKRNSSVRAFLPLTDETVLSTRGQNLPSLISYLSSSLQPRPHQSDRRGSIIFGSDERDLESGLRRPTYDRSASRERSGDWSRRPSLYLASGLQSTLPCPPSDAGDENESTQLMTPQVRSMRLIGNSNPRYRWEQYWKTDEELSKMKKPIREYYEKNNSLIQQYVYIDRLLDSSLPHDLIQEYHNPFTTPSAVNVPKTIAEEAGSSGSSSSGASQIAPNDNVSHAPVKPKVNRTPQNLYRIPDERSPLLQNDEDAGSVPDFPQWRPEEETGLGDRIVKIAIYVNLAANSVLLVLKVIVTVLTSSVSVLAALVDAILDLLSTAIVWTTTQLISRNDDYLYPVGRRRLEPIGVLVFSVIMITSFVQVAFEGLGRLTGKDHRLVVLGVPAIAIMAATVIIKGFCWMWCRFIKNSSVQALAQDAATDVVFNTFSIFFPLVGYYMDLWYLDSLGGIILSMYVIYAWLRTTTTHIRNLSGAAATADERNVLLYLTMRFAKTIKQIQALQAYHSGDKLIVEVDIVLDGDMNLRDCHDLGESLQYTLESVPTVERAFVHLDYLAENLPSHMRQQ